MTWIDWLVHLIVNSALASHNRGKTMNYAGNSVLTATEVESQLKSMKTASLTESAINEIQASISDLHLLIEQHEGRIGACLRTGGTAEAGSSAPSPRAVPESALLERLDAIRGEIARARTRLTDINQRVTL